MTEPIHHFHRRKRIRLEPYPHPNRWVRFLDRIVYAVGAFLALMTLPQLMKIWIDRNAAGVSLISWAAYLVGSCVWVTYGITHKEKPIIFTYSAMFVMELLIVIGVLLYG